MNDISSIFYRAFAEEMQAFYRYFIVQDQVSSNDGEYLRQCLANFALEELQDHAMQLLSRMHSLHIDVTPIINPNSWSQFVGCQLPFYEAVDAMEILNVNIQAEQCSVDTYHLAIQQAKDVNDRVSEDMFAEFLKDEEAHLTKLVQLQLDFQHPYDTPSTKQLNDSLKANPFVPTDNYIPVKISDGIKTYHVQSKEQRIFDSLILNSEVKVKIPDNYDTNALKANLYSRLKKVGVESKLQGTLKDNLFKLELE